MEAGNLVMVVAKIVGDLKAAGIGSRTKDFLDAFDSCFKLAMINNGPGKLRFFGINTPQDNEFTISTDANGKLEAIIECPLSRQRLKET